MDHELFKFDFEVLHENSDMLKYVGYSDCPVGWAQLVRQLFEDIREVCIKDNTPLPKVLQVKSKFGGLCFYLDHDDIFKNSISKNEISHLVYEAEKKSRTICEITGQPGILHDKNGWLATLSETKAKELGYVKRITDQA